MDAINTLYGQPWEPREYLVVLAAYLKHRGQLPSVDSREIHDLSGLLGRTPSAILMRMENFASLDKAVPRKGLAHISPMCRKYFDEWAFRPDHLQSLVDFIVEERRIPHQTVLFEKPPIRIPTALRHYELLEQIGQGGFGEVYSCIKQETGKLFALKIIRGDKAQDPEALHRFTREMRTLKSINSPHVIQLYEDNLESEQRLPAFVMDLGLHSLSEYIHQECAVDHEHPARPRLPTDTAIVIMRSMLEAIKALHSQIPSIVHRDINPNNIIQLPDGRWVLADFSLAKFLNAAASTFSTHTQRGWATTYYAPPEQHQYFKHTDEKADIYALGILIWELFSPSWPPPRLENSQLPEPLDHVFRTAAHPEYDERYTSVRLLAEAFEDACLKLL